MRQLMRPLFIALLFIGSITSSCKSDTHEETRSPTSVTAFEVQPATIPAVFNYVGFAESTHLVEIRARVEGYLDKIAYTEGSFVENGQLLFQLDPKPFIAALDNAKGLLAKAKAILWNANTTVNRLKPLFAQDAISKRDLDNAIASQLAAQAEVDSANAQVVEAELKLGYTTIATPVTGLSGKSHFREGALITLGPDSSMLTTVSVIDPIWIYFSVSETDILTTRMQASKGIIKLPKDNNFDVRLILGNDFVYPELGKVDFTSPTLNQSTGTLEARAVFANPLAILKPGQFVKVQVLGTVRPDAIIIPQQAVQQGQKGMYVYIIDKDNKAEMVEIDPGEWFENYWIIKSGLKPGDLVVSDGVNKVYPGLPVTITKQIKYIPQEEPKLMQGIDQTTNKALGPITTGTTTETQQKGS
ncbi:MAG: efflux RND transporter periplasmic adaptor subunit [Chlamydiales bacterium]|nr:efflux RND transporter periplasmic adaptor subunit [Chlamydiales bacterium]